MKRISITDIARELNVTPSTVSRALNGGPRISDKTRQLVLDLARKWGYRPNPLAKGLISRKTYNIGLIIPEFTHHFFNQVLRGIESFAVSKGYHLVICTSDNDYEKEKKSVETLLDLRVDGFLVALGNNTQKFDHFQDILSFEVPLVFIDRTCEDIETPYVITNDFEGAFQATEHLISSGSRQIVYIHGPTHISTTFNRLMGYREALKKWNIPYSEDFILDGSNTKTLCEKLSKLLKSNSIDAVFAHNDYLAYEAFNVIKQQGFQVPKDILLMGYANEPIAEHMTPSLSTVQQPAFDMGKKAACLLIQQLESGYINKELLTQCIPTSLVIRDSTLK
ncbi:LacI family DNA-binding transcriptional regulator [Catalinimonas niigatensis]|uniref:LacI family DNA-binding transcriptional regulator n=1 Tax=Catalinimonas niigatensis TaxID=1397264 RepID=UPI00266527C9|nr:LacI family DNA-binding transcriptional regulator [Catalinimonas niigatensis]WPP48797.1 LacI family DNA-binding transcriptional regulator [Catalinimonas niigatensis]